MAQWVKNLTSIHEEVGLIPGLAQWVKGSSIAVSCGVGHRHSSDWVLLWLWHRLAAAALIQCLGPSIYHGCGPKKKKNLRNQYHRRDVENCLFHFFQP